MVMVAVVMRSKPARTHAHTRTKGKRRELMAGAVPGVRRFSRISAVGRVGAGGGGGGATLRGTKPMAGGSVVP